MTYIIQTSKGTYIYSLMEYSSIRGGGGKKLRFLDSIRLEITLMSHGGEGVLGGA